MPHEFVRIIIVIIVTHDYIYIEPNPVLEEVQKNCTAAGALPVVAHNPFAGKISRNRFGEKRRRWGVIQEKRDRDG